MRTVMLLASEDMCDILQSELNNKCRALPCSDPAACRELLDQAPDALILDLFLPGIDGLSFLRESAGLLPPVVVVLTRFLNDVLLRELETLSVSAVIRIPYSFAYLEQQLITLL